MRYDVDVNGRRRQVIVRRVEGRFVISVDGREWTVDAVRVDPQTWSLLIEDAAPGVRSVSSRGPAVSHEVAVAPGRLSGQLDLRIGSVSLAASVNSRRWGRREEGVAGSGPQRIVAPMPGKVVRVLVRPGEAVAARQPVVVIEAMKMENELRAARAGTIKEIHARDGQSVEAGALLAVITD